MPSRFYHFFSFICLLLLTFTSPSIYAEAFLPQSTTGHLERIELPSKFVESRPVDVWLPSDYVERVNAGQRFQVIYMHDGQMLFDSTHTWNKQSWHIDVTLDRLIRNNQVPPTIVVAIWNRDKFRASEYFPQKVLERLPPSERTLMLNTYLEKKAQSDNYLRYLVTELKPFIDKQYATKSERSATFVMGSSRGAVLSVYAMSEYPEIFGGAAGLSVHWIGKFERNATIPLASFAYLNDHLADPVGHRLYLDRGTETLDALYGPSFDFANEVIRERGYNETNYMHRVFPGTDHSETAWSNRLEIPLLFLLSK